MTIAMFAELKTAQTRMVEPNDALVSGTSGESRGGSSPFLGTKHGTRNKKRAMAARISPGGLFFCVAAATGGNGIPGCPALLLEGVTQNNRFLTIRAG